MNLNQSLIPAFGVGSAKSGTHSLAGMFQDSLRSAHEPAAELLLNLILRRYAGKMDEMDFGRQVSKLFTALNAGLNVSQLNGFIIETIYRLYPHGRYILTVRSPEAWLRSFVNHQITRPLEPRSAWHGFRELRFDSNKYPYAVEDSPLRNSGLYSLDAYLSYWVRHNANVIATVPAKQLYIVPTEQIANEAEAMARFLGLRPETVNRAKAHDFSGKYDRTPIDELDKHYLCGRIDFFKMQLQNAMRDRLAESGANHVPDFL